MRIINYLCQPNIDFQLFKVFMKFASPEILYALFLLIIPVIIHLFNFKKFKKVYFSNLGFLKQVSQQSKKTSQIRHLLVLITRLLFLAFIILAFAKPYFPNNQNSQENNKVKQIAVYIDNSFSMQQKGRSGVLLEEAKSIARELAQAYRPTDKYKLLTNDIYSFDGGFMSRDDYMSDVRNANFLPFSISLSEVISKSNGLQLQPETKPTDIFLISDFQKSISDLNKILIDTSVNIWLIPLKAPVPSNIYIDSCWIEDPVVMRQKPVKIKFRISKNFVGDDITANLKLVVNEKQKGISTISLSNEPIVETFSFLVDSSYKQSGYIQLDDHPITFDDEFFFSFTVRQSHKVVIINFEDDQSFLQRFYQSDSSIILKNFNEKQIDYNALLDANLLILNSVKNYSSGFISEVEKFIEAGGNVVVILSTKSDLSSLNYFNEYFGLPLLVASDTSRIEARKIDVQSPLFRDVFNLTNNELPANTNMPFFKYRYRFVAANSGNLKTEIELADGQPLLTVSKYKAGNIYYFTAALDSKNSNLGRHALFIPLFYNMMLNNSGENKLYYTLDEDVVNIPNLNLISDQSIHIVNHDKTIDFIPGIRKTGGFIQIFPEGRILESGNYFAESVNSSYPISFNYSSKESKLNCFANEELQELIDNNKLTNTYLISGENVNLQSQILSTNNHNELWKIFVIIGLLFLVIEVFLLRFLK